MRRTPDKDTIIKLREQGLTLAEIGKRYGVSGVAVHLALNYIPAPPRPPEPPKEPKVPRQPCTIPLHVINYWRTEWGWSQDKINQTILLYNQSLLERNGGAVHPPKKTPALPETPPEQRGRPAGSNNVEPITRPEFRRRRLRELFLRTKERMEK